MKLLLRAIVPPPDAVFLSLFLTLLVLGGNQPAAGGQFASGVSAVEVYATVTDRQGQPVTGLSQQDFRVEEDGEPQTLRSFSAGQFPLALAIGVDRSFSVSAAGLAGVASAVRSLLSELRADDQAMVMTIGSETEIVAPLSVDRRPADAALARIESWGTTPLYDATLSAVDAIQSAAGRRALILISDGTDRYSRLTAADLLDAVRKKDVLIYPIALGRTRPAIFAELATVTGGRSFQVADVGMLRATLTTIATELRFQYLLGYAPASDGTVRPGWHSIHVAVSKTDARVRARDGYYVSR